MLMDKPVPSLSGRAVKTPKRSLLAKPWPACCKARARDRSALQSRSKATLTLSPLSMQINCMCSSSFTQAPRPPSSLRKTPRASGQSRPRPMASFVEVLGSWKSIPFACKRRESSCAMPTGFAEWLVEPANGKYSPFRAPLNSDMAWTSSRSTSHRSSAEQADGKDKPAKFRARRKRTESTREPPLGSIVPASKPHGSSARGCCVPSGPSRKASSAGLKTAANVS
mmetsp:Transcript_79882/g.202009  ORF Transcript_79882/g.202009 Transcript_79882/m.202009 type:complete len:225 (+) Transcript_79882:324-998(+)